MKGMLTLTIITQRATSLNYGESLGNVSILKKLSLGDNSQITYVSDKALKYDIKRKGKEEKEWKLLDERLRRHIENSTRNRTRERVDLDYSLVRELFEYQEFDLFGGLFTKDLFKAENLYFIQQNRKQRVDSIKRSSPVKITYAFSISRFKGDMDFMNNIDAFNRYIKHIPRVRNSEKLEIP